MNICHGGWRSAVWAAFAFLLLAPNTGALAEQSTEALRLLQLSLAYPIPPTIDDGGPLVNRVLTEKVFAGNLHKFVVTGTSVTRTQTTRTASIETSTETFKFTTDFSQIGEVTQKGDSIQLTCINKTRCFEYRSKSDTPPIPNCRKAPCSNGVVEDHISRNSELTLTLSDDEAASDAKLALEILIQTNVKSGREIFITGVR
jgi:hypothetical protein